MKDAEIKDTISYVAKNNNLQELLKFANPMSKPASFYIPKIHKQFVSLPTGRPISSAIKAPNEGISMLLNSILQPIQNRLPDVIKDTPHLLLLLRQMVLLPGRR